MQYYRGLPMSIDEKYSTIGRIVSERIEARKQLSLLRT